MRLYHTRKRCAALHYVFIFFYQLLIVVIDKIVLLPIRFQFVCQSVSNLFPIRFQNVCQSVSNLFPIRFQYICQSVSQSVTNLLHPYANLGAQNGYLLGNLFGYRLRHSENSMLCKCAYCKIQTARFLNTGPGSVRLYATLYILT